jgi:hypothetical protein
MYARRLSARLVAVQSEGSTGFSIQWGAVLVVRGQRAPFTFTLLDDLGRWRLAGVEPPDLSVLRARPLAVARPPAAAVRAAARFAVGYADFAEDAVRRPPHAMPGMVRTIAAGSGPLRGPVPSRVPARLVRVVLGPREGRELAASATVVDAGRTLGFSFLMLETGGGWEADGFIVG